MPETIENSDAYWINRAVTLMEAEAIEHNRQMRELEQRRK